jgi:[acyl-carrier-protein] S-malonyltransferase
MPDTLKIAALFPGQGAQYPGMVRELFNEFSWTRELFEEASDSIGIDLVKLCLDGPEDELQLTANAQPAILTTSYAWYQVLAKNLDFKPSAAAGHSLGEYSALLAAGAFTLAEGVRLVRTRGTLMQSAVPRGVGKMAALLGLTDEQTQELCKRATESESSLVVPANFNSPGQVVIAGHTDAVERAELMATTVPELKARKVIPLKVSAPFHCPLMNPVAEQFVASLNTIQWKPLSFSVVHNLDAKAHKQADLVPLLRDQIDHPVLWTQCQAELEQMGHTHYAEMGPGKVLSGLGKRIVSKGTFVSVESAKDVKSVEVLFREGMK